MPLTPVEQAMLEAIDACLPSDTHPAILTGDADLRSHFEVSALASTTIVAATRQLARVMHLCGQPTNLSVDRSLASAWFSSTIQPIGWQLPPIWDAIAGDYPCADGWIRIHTNAPHHKLACQSVLGPHDTREAVAAVLAGACGDDIEAAIVAAGGCAARMRSCAEWAAHAQGKAVAAEPLIDVAALPIPSGSPTLQLTPRAGQPLHGLRVLDLTRILAGPTATRFLAAFGADVLRIDPPGWEEPSVVPDVTLGKRCARLDLKRSADRDQFAALLAQADVLIHGYRPGAMAALGYDTARLRSLAPHLVAVSLCAYGDQGPWAGRRGFDSLVQMSCGIADAGMHAFAATKPTPLPVQALDYATGYLMAAAALYGIGERLAHGRSIAARLSLARTAELLKHHPRSAQREPVAGAQADAFAPQPEHTPWGPVRRRVFPVSIDGVPVVSARPAAALGSSPPSFGY